MREITLAQRDLMARQSGRHLANAVAQAEATGVDKAQTIREYAAHMYYRGVAVGLEGSMELFTVVNPRRWREDDPREIIGKRSIIAICVDGRIFGGRVETKHGWSIQLHTDLYASGYINADEPWPKGWRWVFVPSTTRSK